MPQVPASAPKPTAYDTHVNREASSKAFEARQAPAFKSSVGERTYTPQQVQEKRRTYYTTVYRDRYVPTPTVAGGSYGSFSDVFMWSMIWNSAFAHNRSDDPDYRSWRQEADERARTDEKLRERLAELDKEVETLKAQGAPKDPNYVPNDVPPEVVFREDALTAKREPNSWIAWITTFIVLAGFAFIFLEVFRSRRRIA